MSALAERLRALRAQAGAPVAPSPTGASLREELRRLLGVRARATSPATTITSLDRDLPGTEIAPGLRMHEQRRDDVPAPAANALATLLPAADQGLRPLLFDTETTGLAGGTGTRAFQIGAADWHEGVLRIRQLTLTSLAAEPALLAAFAGWLDADTQLVSYNGKCFDAPLLATRYRLARIEDPLRDLAHLDLLYPVRRRYRGHWENCRLATVERRLLGIERNDDLPGSEAPRAFLTYLRGGSACDLRRVGEHNAQDLVSLAGLLMRLAGDAASGSA